MNCSVQYRDCGSGDTRGTAVYGKLNSSHDVRLLPDVAAWQDPLRRYERCRRVGLIVGLSSFPVASESPSWALLGRLLGNLQEPHGQPHATRGASAVVTRSPPGLPCSVDPLAIIGDVGHSVLAPRDGGLGRCEDRLGSVGVFAPVDGAIFEAVTSQRAAAGQEATAVERNPLRCCHRLV